MAVMKIVTWPNPILDTPADPVTKFDDGLKKIVNDMFETMYDAPGVGLAAVQVGIPQRLFHGTADANVPLEISDRYVHTAQLRGDEARLITLEGANHFDVVDPRTKEFALVRESAIDLLR